jgi:hypothetical protein
MKIGDKFRIIGESVGSINEFARINHIYEDDSIWISNLNMPYLGTVSKIVSKDKIEILK